MTKHTRQIALFTHAKQQSQYGIWLGFLAIACFCVFGTLGSMARFADSGFVYACFYYLPYVLIGLGVPFSLYHGFLAVRYRIIQTGILGMAFGLGVLSFLLAVVFLIKNDAVFASMSGFLGLIVWFALPYLFKVNFKRYLDFLETSHDRHDTHA